MVSVKDRAKMFGTLASPDDAGKDRSYRQIGNKVSSSPFRSVASPKAKFSSSPFTSSSPNTGSRNLSSAFSNQDEKKQIFKGKNNIEWPDEDEIPAPDPIKKDFITAEQNFTPVATNTTTNSPSPFKVLSNQKSPGKLPTFESSKSNFEARKSPPKTLSVWEQRIKPQNTITIDSTKKNEDTIEASNLTVDEEKDSTKTVDTPLELNESTPVESINDTPVELENPSQDSSISNHKQKPTRAMRLQKARRASREPTVSNNLKQSLQAANVVMQQEKSEAGASDASSRSSLSNKELSIIAKRALEKSKDKISSSQEARRALLSVTTSKHKRGIENGSPSERLGMKASRALAMKNSIRTKGSKSSQNDMDIMKTLSTHSNDTSRSRRLEHPAFAARPVKNNISSAHMLASFHQFKIKRQSFPTKPKQVKSDSDAKKESKKYFDDDFDETYSDDDSLRSTEQEESMHSVREMPSESMHSMSGRLERSMHSRSGRKFAHMGKIHIARNNCNDTVISSLSGNTQSLQSVPSRMMSPRSKGVQKTSIRLDPTPEDPLIARKAELARILSPGPSNRSGHSVANSIISASPRADYRSPSVRENVNTSFMDTLEEKPSSSQESTGNSAELLDAALAVAVEDMDIIDSPRTNPSAFSDGKTLQILSSSSNGRSDSPGFVFKDTEESDHMVPPDPVGNVFAPTSTAVGIEIENCVPPTTKAENGDSKIENQEVPDSTEPVNFDATDKKSNFVYQKHQGSTSTKQTVSTSIRSGMSSIQDGADVEMKSDPVYGSVDRDTYEGSTSIRTGLSGIQRDSMEHSISIHTTVPSEEKETVKVEKPDVPQYPDTIEEENEVKSTQKSKLSLRDDNTSFSGLKVKPTATTDRSSGTTTGGSANSDQVSSDPSGNDDRIDLGNNPVNTNGNNVSPLQTEGNASEEMSNNGFSLLSPGSRSSRAWRNGFGKSIGNAIKNALAKASPKASDLQSKQEDNDEAESLFDDDEDDIFGGLEVEQVEAVVQPKTPSKRKLDEKTPRLKNEKKEFSVSQRTNGTLSQRTNESFSRRANGSLSRRKSQSKSRKSFESGNTLKNRKSVPLNSSTPKKLLVTPSQQHKRTALSPSTMKPASLYTNDRSGIIVDSEVVHNVNSDITSSLIGGPISGQPPFHKAMKEASKFIDLGGDKKEDVVEEIPESDHSKEDMGGSFTKFMEDTITSSVEQTALEAKSEPIDEETLEEDHEEGQRIGSMFLNFGCGLVDSCNGFANLCTPGDKDEDDVADETLIGGGDNKDSGSVSSRSELTTLEKKVWNEWDRLNGTALGFKKTSATTDGEDKPEEGRDAALTVANKEVKGAEKSQKATPFENDQRTTLSASHSTESESGFTKESESGESGNSFGNTVTSGESIDDTLSRDSTRYTYSSNSYSSCDESDLKSDDPSRSVSSTAARPMLLSFSQRSLMEKFSKQLTAVGVQVLKLNTRKQWQIRYFTVSMEQIALSAHEAISKTGETAFCPKALLWLKKFNPKNGGYGIVNIDKNGHGGMLLVDLVDIQVSEKKDDMLENPIPKKLADRFDNSVLVTLKYKMKGILRSIEFRCGDNDEAQFLCTCMRVIRDLLRRERSLRQKLSKQVPNKN